MSIFFPVSSLKATINIGAVVKNSTLTTAVRVKIKDGAQGILVQAVDGDIYFAFGDSTIVADTDSFIISASSVAPFVIELQSDMYISFLEKDSGAAVVYQLIR